MASVKKIRLLESTMVVLFLTQAFRALFGQVLSIASRVLENASSPTTLIISQVALIAGIIALIPITKIMRNSTLLTSIFVLMVAIFRFTMTLGDPLLALISTIIVIIAGAGYLITLLKINRFIWSSAIIIAMASDLLLRAFDSYDLSMRPWFEVTIGNDLYRIPFLIVQLILSFILIGTNQYLRKNNHLEERLPGSLQPWAGLALGGFLSLQFIVLFLPNVISRWTALPYESIAPWLALMITLPLTPGVRAIFGTLVSHIEDSLKGWILFFLLVVLLIIGYRLSGIVASSALLIAEFVGVMLIWWLSDPAEANSNDQTAQSIILGVIIFILSIYLYSLTFEDRTTFSLLQGQTLTVVILQAILISLPLIVAPDSNPWLAVFEIMSPGSALTMVILIVGGTYFLSLPGQPADFQNNTIRVATYNINYGYDQAGEYQFPQIALAVKASDADILALQEVDTGHPMSYGMDQVQYLARHFHLTPVFQPDPYKLRGMAILSAYPITATRGDLLTTHNGNALMLAADLTIPGVDRPIQMLAGSLKSANQNERLAQFALLMDLIDINMPAILAADFAGSTSDVVYQQFILSGFSDPDTLLGIEINNTYPAVAPLIRQDLILLNGFTPLSSFQVDSTASDHRLVLVETVAE